MAVPAGSNEIGVIPELLRTLDLAGAVVAIDAAGCQIENARIGREQGGHYLLAVKGNPIRTIFSHQLLSKRRFFAEFAGLNEPAVEELLPAGSGPPARRTSTSTLKPRLR